jgi:hypothetical protein
MKINEAIVIDNKVIDELMAECMHSAIYEVLEYIKSQSKPLEPIIQDAWENDINQSEDLRCKELDFIQYLNDTEI